MVLRFSLMIMVQGSAVAAFELEVILARPRDFLLLLDRRELTEAEHAALLPTSYCGLTFRQTR